MSELSTPVIALIILAIALIVYVILWRLLGQLGQSVRKLVRIVLAILIFAPAVYLTASYLQLSQQTEKSVRSSAPPAKDRSEPARKKVAAPRKPATRGLAPGGGAGGSSAPAPKAKPKITMTQPPATAPEAKPKMVQPPAGRIAPAPPKSGAAPPPPPGSSGAPSAAPRSAGAPPAAAPKKPEKDFDTVHVFYGTDRTIKDTPKRVGYSSERGRKLLLGKAVVTVPSEHKVPNVERPWKIKIPYLNITVYEQAEDPKKHFTIQDIKRLEKSDFLKLVRERMGTSVRNKEQALVFIHGYNNTFDGALYRTAQIAYDLRFDGLPFLYSWPSGGGLASYNYDRDSSRQAEPYLREFLQIVINETGAKGINIIAHSMGNLPLLHVLREIKLLAANKPDVRINQIIMAAPDVDRDVFINLARTISGIGSGMTLYASSSDKAMLASRTFGGGVPRAGDVPPGGPVVVAGIDTIDVTAVSTELLAINHSGYARSKALLNDIELLIRTGERPPEKRIPILQRIEQGGQIFWRYPG